MEAVSSADRITYAISRYTRYIQHIQREATACSRRACYEFMPKSGRARERHHHSLCARVYPCAIVHRCAWQMQRASRNVKSPRGWAYARARISSQRSSTVARIAGEFRLRKITMLLPFKWNGNASRRKCVSPGDTIADFAILRDVTPSIIFPYVIMHDSRNGKLYLCRWYLNYSLNGTKWIIDGNGMKSIIVLYRVISIVTKIY